MFFLFLFLWILLSARLDWQIVLAGAVVSALVYRFSLNYLRYRPGTDAKLWRHLPLMLVYAATLVVETGRSTLAVMRIVFSRKPPLEPLLFYFRSGLKSNVANVVLANTNVLTPGTITVSLDGALFCVHCLNAEMAKDLADSVFLRQLRNFEEGSPNIDEPS